MAVLALSVAAPAAAQEAPGWLNWGGDAANEANEGADGQDGQAGQGSAQPMAERARSVDMQSESGQAVLLQRLMQRVDDLERQAQEMRGRLSEQERAIERQQKRHEQALREMEAQLSTAAVAGRMPQESPGRAGDSEPARTAGAQGEDATDAADSAQASAETQEAGERVTDEEQQALYNEAFEVLKSGKYEQAITAFQKVIDANPQGSWAPSALFWQGETYYVQQDYSAARKAYAEMVQRFPDSNRVPDAKLKLGYIAQEQDDIDSARALFNEILAEYPDSQAAGLAKNRLNRLERSGG